MMYRISILLLLIAAFVSSTVAASAPIFCKCTCFNTSHIIPLGPPHDSDSKKPPPIDDNPPAAAAAADKAPASPKQSSLSDGFSARADVEPAAAARRSLERRAPAYCTQCTRPFCYDYNLPGCENAELKDFVTSCFQRDSRKDQIIVWVFILGTTGLLGWAAAKRLLELREVKELAAGIPGVRALAGMAGGGARAGGSGMGGQGLAPGLQRRRGSPSNAAGGQDDRLRGEYANIGTEGNTALAGPG